MLARRIAAVATPWTSLAPTSRAICSCSTTTSDDLVDLGRGDLAVLGHSPAETREGALLVDLSSRSPSHSATSKRVVFEPMSMQARRTPTERYLLAAGVGWAPARTTSSWSGSAAGRGEVGSRRSAVHATAETISAPQPATASAVRGPAVAVIAPPIRIPNPGTA